MKKCLFTIFVLFSVPGCSPEVGSEEWCVKMQEKPNGEWTQNEMKNYAKSCLFK